MANYSPYPGLLWALVFLYLRSVEPLQLMPPLLLALTCRMPGAYPGRRTQAGKAPQGWSAALQTRKYEARAIESHDILDLMCAFGTVCDVDPAPPNQRASWGFESQDCRLAGRCADPGGDEA